MINCQRIFKLQRTSSNTYSGFYGFSKGAIDVGIRFRNVSATSAIKRPFAVQIITDASDVRLFFFSRGRRILDCALISAVRLIRDDAFSGISERFITKKVPLSVRWTADVTLAVFLLPRVLSYVVTYSFDLQFRSANGFLARAVKIRHEFAVRADKTRRKNGISDHRVHRAHARRCGRKVEKTYEILRQIGWTLHESSSNPFTSFPFYTAWFVRVMSWDMSEYCSSLRLFYKIDKTKLKRIKFEFTGRINYDDLYDLSTSEKNVIVNQSATLTVDA